MKKSLILALLVAPHLAHAQTIPQFSTGEVVSAAKLNAATKGPLDVLSTGVGLQNTGQFYRSSGANVTRLGDRLFVGAASDNPASVNRTQTPTDWLTTMMAATPNGAWAMQNAQAATIARYGGMALVAGTRTSDAVSSATLLGHTPPSIGVASWAINNDTTAGAVTNGWAYYGEAWRMSGVNNQPTFAAELEGVNFGGATVGISNPYQVNHGGGVYTLQLGCGGGMTGTSDCDAGITFVTNPARFSRGIVFQNTSLAGTDGLTATGIGSAIEMGQSQSIAWRTPETVSGLRGLNYGLFIRSNVTAGANATRIDAFDTGLVVSNSSGQPIITVGTRTDGANYLRFEAGPSGSAPGIYTQPVSSGGGSNNLGLYPAAGGELQISSPVCNSGGSTPATTSGFLQISVNGTDMRVPLYVSAQAGC